MPFCEVLHFKILVSCQRSTETQFFGYFAIVGSISYRFYNSYFSQVKDLFAETTVTPPFKLNSPVNLLQESQAGTIFSPSTFELIICAPNVAELEQFSIEHRLGHDFPELLIQCCFHVPQLQLLSLVPFLFFQLFAVILIIILLKVYNY